MTTNDPITLNAAQAAGVLGLAPSTLAKLRLSGDGPVCCKLGRSVVYRRADLEAWLESRVARDTSDADARLPKCLTVRRLSAVVDRTAGGAECDLVALENERGRR
jgi:predicted DNA-binding transcriptional regulator AlpA